MPVLSPSLNPLKALHRLRCRYRARQLRRRLGHPLPVWALGEVRLAAPAAGWLQKMLCAWHALPAPGLHTHAGEALPLNELTHRLATQGLDLWACRLAEAGGLRPGDVVVLCAPLHGRAASLALLVDVSIDGDGLRLHLAPTARQGAEVLACSRRQLQPAMAGWVLRSRPQAGRTGMAAPAPLALAA